MFNVSAGRSASKHYKIKRVEYPWMKYMISQSWKALHSEMVDFFRRRKPSRSSTVTVHAESWPKFVSKEQLINEGYVPCVVWKYGEERRIILKREHIDPVAFDDIGENSHVSSLFKSRLIRLVVDNQWLENCVVTDVSAHVNNQELFFLKMARHIPGRVTCVDLPISLTGLLGCPAILQGAQVDLAMHSIKIECIGDEIPPPLLLDVSKLRYEPPYTKITLGDVEKLILNDGKTRLSREYSEQDRDMKEVVLCYEVRGIEERPLPDEYQDPNFFNRKGRKYHVTYSGFWPRQ